MINNRKINIVVVDDELYICNIITEALSSERTYNIISYCDPREGIEYIKNNTVDLVLTDLIMGEYTGIQVLDSALSHHSDAIVILMTAHPTVETAISVLKKGAYDFLLKPFKLELLKASIKRGLEHQKLLRDNVYLKGQVEFLKTANASEAIEDIDSFLKTVVESCQTELSANAVSLIEIDPVSKDTRLAIYNSSSEKYREMLLDEETVYNFIYTKSTKPIIQREQVEQDGENVTQIFISLPIFISRRLHGVINLLIIRKFDELTPGQLDVLTILGNAASSAISNYCLYNDLEDSYLHAIKGLANSIEARDPYTAGHTDRVCRLAEQIAIAMKWDKKRIDYLIMGCTLHDIGKIGVPDAILNKPSRLTKEEREKMISHPKVGLKIIRGINLFKPAIPYIIAHHEWYDGSGYPKGLKGEEIPIEGRLLTVADTFDAIMSDRPYRDGGSLETAVLELIKFKRIQFDPEIVDIFLKIIKRKVIDLKEMYGRDEDYSIFDQLEVSEKVPV